MESTDSALVMTMIRVLRTNPVLLDDFKSVLRDEVVTATATATATASGSVVSAAESKASAKSAAKAAAAAEAKAAKAAAAAEAKAAKAAVAAEAKAAKAAVAAKGKGKGKATAAKVSASAVVVSVDFKTTIIDGMRYAIKGDKVYDYNDLTEKVGHCVGRLNDAGNIDTDDAVSESSSD